MTPVRRVQRSERPEPVVSERLYRAVSLLILAGLAVITAVTFLTSFDAIANVAEGPPGPAGAVGDGLGWTIPLAIDGLIVVASACLWLESLEGRWHAFPLAVVAVDAALSVVANVAHADTTLLLHRILAGVPPVFLTVSVELAAWQVRRRLRRHHTHHPDTIGDGSDMAGPVDPDRLEPTSPNLPLGDRARLTVAGHVAAGGALSDNGLADAIAVRVGCSVKTAQHAIAAHTRPLPDTTAADGPAALLSVNGRAGS